MKKLCLIWGLLASATVFAQSKMDECLLITQTIDSVMVLKRAYEAHLVLERYKARSSDDVLASIKRTDPTLTDRPSAEFLAEYKKKILELKANKATFFNCHDAVLEFKQENIVWYEYQDPLSSVVNIENRMSYARLLQIIQKYVLENDGEVLPNLKHIWI